MSMSVIEFSHLVALALDTDFADRFSASLFPFDHHHHHHHHHANTSLASLSSPPSLTSTAMSCSAVPCTPQLSSPGSRTSKIFNKIKRQAASILITRSQAPSLLTTSTPFRYAGNHHLSGSSFFDNGYDEQGESVAEFAPYLPLAVQHERAAAVAAAAKAKSALSIFSRSASATTSPPPSPKSCRSVSSAASSVAGPLTPLSPIFGTRASRHLMQHQNLNVDQHDDQEHDRDRRWSYGTESSVSMCYQNHPFATATPAVHEEDADPFAKGSVQVVLNAPFASPSSLTQRRRTAPILSPPPSGPLSNIPLLGSPSPSPDDAKSESLRIHVVPPSATSTTFADGELRQLPRRQDWTLSLPLGVRLPGRSTSDSEPSPPTSPLSGSPSPGPDMRFVHRPRPRSFLSHNSVSSSSSESSSSSSCSHSNSPCRSLHSHSRHPASSRYIPPASPPPSRALPPIPSDASIRSASTSNESVTSQRASSPLTSFPSPSPRPSSPFPLPPRTADSTASSTAMTTITSTSSSESSSSSTVVPMRGAPAPPRPRRLGPLPKGQTQTQARTHRQIQTRKQTSTSTSTSTSTTASTPKTLTPDNVSILSEFSGESGTYHSARSSFSSSLNFGFGKVYL